MPHIAGGLEYVAASGVSYTLALWQELVTNEGDAWVYTQDELGRYLERVESELARSTPAEVVPPAGSLLEIADQAIPAAAQEVIGPYLQSVAQLGQRTAELHLALASGESTGLRTGVVHQAVSAERLPVDARPGTSYPGTAAQAAFALAGSHGRTGGSTAAQRSPTAPSVRPRQRRTDRCPADSLPRRLSLGAGVVYR